VSLKLIFLDIDGVLNSRATFQENFELFGHGNGSCDLDMIDTRYVRRLNTLIRETDAKVVISSSWRITSTLDEIRGFLSAKGFVGEIIGETPVLPNLNTEKPDYGRRGREISEYLKSINGLGSYVILDDSCDMGEHMPYLVRTNMETGLLDHHVVAAKYILEN
jgi:hypothetical protein